MNRRVFLSENDVCEIVSPDGLSALKVRIVTGSKGNTHALVASQPFVRAHVDLPQHCVKRYLEDDPTAEENWSYYV